MKINKLLINTEENYKPNLRLPMKKVKQESGNQISFTSKFPLLSSFRNPVVSDANISRLGNLIDIILKKSSVTQKEEEAVRNLIQTELYNLRRKDRLLGEGFHESVYRIDDNYAVKMHPKEYASSIIDKNDSFHILKDEYSELKRYYGGVLARFGGFYVLRNLGKHIPAGVPQSIKESKSVDYYRKEYLPTFAQVPQESYNALLEDCAILNRRCDEGIDFYCRVFDFVNSNNIVLKDNNLYWVDNISSSASEKNSTMNILNMMLNKYKLDGFSAIFNGYGESLNYAKTIFDKVIIAGAAVKLPFRGCVDRFSDKNIKNILLNLKIKEDPGVFVEKIEGINKISDSQFRISKMKEYLSSL